MIFNMTRPGLRKLDRVPVLGEDFTYTGNCTVIDDSNPIDGVQWRIKFLTSGVFSVLTADWLVDAFLVGGGHAGIRGTTANGGRGGNGGGIQMILSIHPSPLRAYAVEIGLGGVASVSTVTAPRTTTAFGFSTSASGRAGGFGGATDTDGNPGTSGVSEFYETNNKYDRYAAGGGGGGGFSTTTSSKSGGAGGTDGGGKGGNGGRTVSSSNQTAAVRGASGAANSGSGGGGGGGSPKNSITATAAKGGNGGSGIAIIRKHKEAA